ncbi:unnamed protein product [Ostreobium quekettii]|uniref:Glutaredoxin-related protein n=1 Tax=Ostreobium quekettii TaxID=121088 RepID=A0A8S1IT15_9CHLO|nr:unnamed protein product [Ostreobium quekettii]
MVSSRPLFFLVARLLMVAAPYGQVVAHFWAPWSEQCKHMDTVLQELCRTYPQTGFVRVEAEEVVDLSEKYSVAVVPLFLFFQSGQLVYRLEGADALALTEKVQEYSGTSTAAPNTEDVEKRIKVIIDSEPIMLFMKGTPEAPRCKFSSKVVGVLRELGISFGHFDILSDEKIRQGLKEYSQWPTFPQLYVKAEFIGGCDIILEMQQSGELRKTLEQALGPSVQPGDPTARLKSLVTRSPIMLFMKGSPDEPRCGFSARVVEMLRGAGVSFGHFDILGDDTVRQGLKEYSQWPTYPQLYANGEFIGGCDIVTELDAAGELLSTIEAAQQAA